MHKLSDLNAYGATWVTATDTRSYGIDTRVKPLPVGYIQEDQPHLFLVGVDIEDIYSMDGIGTISMTFQLLDDPTNFVYFLSGAPAGITLTNNGSGSYTVAGIANMEHWTWCKQHVAVKPPADRITPWQYTVLVDPPAPVPNFGWTTTINFTEDGEDLSDPLDQEFDPGVAEGVSGHPIVTDIYNTDETLYSYSIVLSSTISIDLITSAGSGGTTAWDGIAETYTITGTKTQVNSHLGTLFLTTANETDWQLTYTLTNLASGTITVKTQNWVENVLNAESTNLGVARNYTSNKINTVMPSNPIQIDDGTITGTYTVSLQLGADIGVIGLTYLESGWDAVTRTWTYTGTESECNTALSTVKFYPYKNTTTATTLRYKQWRGTLAQADATITYQGLVNTGTIPGENTYEFTSNSTFTPTFEQAHYLDYQVLVVGGGGAGGQRVWKNEVPIFMFDIENNYSNSTATGSNAIGGGGSGGVVNITDSQFDIFRDATGSTTYTIQIGQGGSRGRAVEPAAGYGNHVDFIAPADGTDTIISDPIGHTLALATGGKRGKYFDNFNVYRTTGYSVSGYGQVDNGEGGYSTTTTPQPSTLISPTNVNEGSHPYDTAVLHDSYTGNDPDVFEWQDGALKYYRGGGHAVSAFGAVFAEGGELAYYYENANYANYGAGGLAGVWDTGPNQTYEASGGDDIESYTSGIQGIVVIQFTQPS